MKNIIFKILATGFFLVILILNIGIHFDFSQNDSSKDLKFQDTFSTLFAKADFPPECSLQVGECIDPVNCYVWGVIGPAIYSFWFEDCHGFCDPSGSNCCYYLSDGC